MRKFQFLYSVAVIALTVSYSSIGWAIEPDGIVLEVGGGRLGRPKMTLDSVQEECARAGIRYLPLRVSAGEPAHFVVSQTQHQAQQIQAQMNALARRTVGADIDPFFEVSFNAEPNETYKNHKTGYYYGSLVRIFEMIPQLAEEERGLPFFTLLEKGEACAYGKYEAVTDVRRTLEDRLVPPSTLQGWMRHAHDRLVRQVLDRELIGMSSSEPVQLGAGVRPLMNEFLSPAERDDFPMGQDQQTLARQIFRTQRFGGENIGDLFTPDERTHITRQDQSLETLNDYKRRITHAWHVHLQSCLDISSVIASLISQSADTSFSVVRGRLVAPMIDQEGKLTPIGALTALAEYEYLPLLSPLMVANQDLPHIDEMDPETRREMAVREEAEREFKAQEALRAAEEENTKRQAFAVTMTAINNAGEADLKIMLVAAQARLEELRAEQEAARALKREKIDPLTEAINAFYKEFGQLDELFRNNKENPEYTTRLNALREDKARLERHRDEIERQYPQLTREYDSEICEVEMQVHHLQGRLDELRGPDAGTASAFAMEDPSSAVLRAERWELEDFVGAQDYAAAYHSVKAFGNTASEEEIVQFLLESNGFERWDRLIPANREWVVAKIVSGAERLELENRMRAQDYSAAYRSIKDSGNMASDEEIVKFLLVSNGYKGWAKLSPLDAASVVEKVVSARSVMVGASSSSSAG